MKDDIVSLIKKDGGRLTSTRKQLINLFEKEDILSLNDIVNKLDTKIDLSTIYRNLNKFIELDYIEKIPINSEVFYAKKVKGKNHKHFLICEGCHKKIELDYCPIEKMDLDFEDFNIVSHKFELIGVCNECRNKK